MSRFGVPRTATIALAVLAFALPFEASAQVGANSAVVNPNRASQVELAELAHVDDALAAALVAKRPFLDMAALHAVVSAALPEEAWKELYKGLFVPINLNTATREEILLVPGVGERMAHEFEEYRPYKALAQFRREIGKYVSKDEVARLERYVTIN